MKKFFSNLFNTWDKCVSLNCGNFCRTTQLPKFKEIWKKNWANNGDNTSGYISKKKFGKFWEYFKTMLQKVWKYSIENSLEYSEDNFKRIFDKAWRNITENSEQIRVLYFKKTLNRISSRKILIFKKNCAEFENILYHFEEIKKIYIFKNVGQIFRKTWFKLWEVLRKFCTEANDKQIFAETVEKI